MGSTRWPIWWQARLPLVPRYRQRVAEVPGHLANPVWVDDPEFDIAYHVRRYGLPRPGTEAQLLDLVSRLTSRPLDRHAAAVGDVPGRGARRTAGSRSSPRPTPRWSTG